MFKGSFLQRLRSKKLIPDYQGAALKSGVDQKIIILPNSMTFRPDKVLEWKKALGQKVYILVKEANTERKFWIKAKKMWPEKGLFLVAP